MLHDIIFVVASSSSLLPWWARRACNERRMFGGIWGGAAIGLSVPRARGRDVGHSHSEAAVYIYLDNICDGM